MGASKAPLSPFYPAKKQRELREPSDVRLRLRRDMDYEGKGPKRYIVKAVRARKTQKIARLFSSAVGNSTKGQRRRR